MLRNTVKAIGWGNVALVAVFAAAWPIQAQDTKPQDTRSPYPTMAPIEQYRMDRDAEIALARTAAPASISRDATVLVMGQKNQLWWDLPAQESFRLHKEIYRIDPADFDRRLDAPVSRIGGHLRCRFARPPRTR